LGFDLIDGHPVSVEWLRKRLYLMERSEGDSVHWNEVMNHDCIVERLPRGKIENCPTIFSNWVWKTMILLINSLVAPTDPKIPRSHELMGSDIFAQSFASWHSQ
jgi:hypothetical protein